MTHFTNLTSFSGPAFCDNAQAWYLLPWHSLGPCWHENCQCPYWLLCYKQDIFYFVFEIETNPIWLRWGIPADLLQGNNFLNLVKLFLPPLCRREPNRDPRILKFPKSVGQADERWSRRYRSKELRNIQWLLQHSEKGMRVLKKMSDFVLHIVIKFPYQELTV